MADDTITAPLRAHARLYDRRIHAALDFPERLVELWPEIAAALDAADELVRVRGGGGGLLHDRRDEGRAPTLAEPNSGARDRSTLGARGQPPRRDRAGDRREAMTGWYYLHENGDLIYKRELGDTAADIRESPFARALWPCNPSDRAGAWRILIEALAAGAQPTRVAELAAKWGCDDADAEEYARRVGVVLGKHGDQFCATRRDFVNIQESPVGFGESALAAMADLCRSLGWTPSKTWGASFADLVAIARETKGGTE